MFAFNRLKYSNTFYFLVQIVHNILLVNLYLYCYIPLIQTEYLTRIPAWLPSTLTSTSLDSAEAVSYRLYRRLSGMPLSKDSEDEVSYGHTSFQRDNHDVHIIHDKDQDIDYNKLEDDELALLRTSLTDCRQLFIDKQTSTSNLSNYTSWLSSHPDHITEQGLKFLKLGSDLQVS